MKIAIIGGGLAGCALAWTLRQIGQEPVVYEAGPELANGASGNASGLYNPRFSALRGPDANFYAAAYSLALRSFKMFDGIDWCPTGVLHLMDTEKKEIRFHKTVTNWHWTPAHMRIVSSDEASRIAGVGLQYDALYLPDGGSVAPKKLCAAYMRDIDYRLNTSVENLEDVDADIIVLACGSAVLKFVPNLPIIPVRGQVTQVKATQLSENIKCSICYEGYFMPAKNGIHTLGATFQPDLNHSNIIKQDDQENIQKLGEAIPGLEAGLEVVEQRASIRATSRDRFPIIGPAPGQENVYVSAAHGSYGVLSSLMGAHLLADMIMDRPRCLPVDVIAALSPQRFKKRA
ncbi:MAG: FAD-dependent 5-carboxymethylaminomethyl-2-thiouridine(34) oxidoreductase MnmC [Sneathiella sp.]|nr:FAD-dependent 5-carboxymethylaminomethyl-2-thiouridine(34) oxidoreductase MnmC [Sneathiella sp.]